MLETFKCAYCNFRTLKFRTNKDGKVKSGWPRLIGHVEDSHSDEMEAMIAAIGPAEPWDNA